MADSKSNQPDAGGQQIECFVGDVRLDLSGWTLIPYLPKPKKSLADVCRELGIPVVKSNGGGIVITGTKRDES